MLDLPALVGVYAEELVARIGDLPDARTLVRRLRAVLAGEPPPPWFPSVSLERFLIAISALEEAMLAHMSWEVEPDPVVRAHARAELRQALALLVRQHGASLDRELTTLKARQQASSDQLARQQALSDGLMRTRHAGLAVLDREGRVLAWSDGALMVTNRVAQDVLGRPIGELLPQVGELVRRGLDQPENDSDELQEGTCPLEREPGMPPAEISYRLGILRRSPGPQNEAAVLSLWDVTELQALRARVVEGNRLQAMSRIAGSVAHEIRNPLNSLFLNTDILELELNRLKVSSPRVDHQLAVIRQEVDRLNAIVADYLSLSRLADRQRETMDLADLLRQLINEVSPSCAERAIILELVKAGGPFMVSVDPRQLHRALTNLVINARDAMANGGTLRLELSREGTEVRLAIRDTGVGMGPDDLQKVATPFFTRKEGGTGLGVYLAREILSAHQGSLELDSVVGEGTTARVHLPAAQD